MHLGTTVAMQGQNKCEISGGKALKRQSRVSVVAKRANERKIPTFKKKTNVSQEKTKYYFIRYYGDIDKDSYPLSYVYNTRGKLFCAFQGLFLRKKLNIKKSPIDKYVLIGRKKFDSHRKKISE